MFVNGSTARMFTAGRRLLVCLLALALAVLPGLSAPALGDGKVFASGETEPFSPDAKLLTVRVAGMKTGDCMLLTLGEASMLVDLGTGSGMDKIREMLDTAGLTGVDCFCNTHCAHINGGNCFQTPAETSHRKSYTTDDHNIFHCCSPFIPDKPVTCSPLLSSY